MVANEMANAAHRLIESVAVIWSFRISKTDY